MNRDVKSKFQKWLKNFIIMLGIIMITSCKEEEKWEYMTVKITGTSSYFDKDLAAFGTTSFPDPTFLLNDYGKDGWELVTSYTEIETVHPNFGNKEYVTGLQPNTRTREITFVMKRKMH